MLLGRERIFGLEFEGRRYDIGDKLDWLKATVELALKREEFSGELQDHLEIILGKRKVGKAGKGSGRK